MQRLLAIIKITFCTVRFLYCGITRIYFTEKKKLSADKITYQKYAKMFPLHLAKAESAFFFCILIWRPKKCSANTECLTSLFSLCSTTQGQHLILPFIKYKEKGVAVILDQNAISLRLVCHLGYLLFSGALEYQAGTELSLSFPTNTHSEPNAAEREVANMQCIPLPFPEQLEVPVLTQISAI